jgi:hypothetical protein
VIEHGSITKEVPMWFTARWLIIAGAVTAFIVSACNNDNFANRGVIAAGARFQLMVEEPPSAARLLLDSATGDLWQLKSESSASSRWIRVASGPADARVLKAQEILGMGSHGTPEPTH